MEYLAKDLQPGVTYAIQIRSVSGTDTSEWSPVFHMVTSSDSSTPGNLGPITGTVIGSSFKLTWAPIAANLDGTVIRDFKDYQISIDDGHGNVHNRYQPGPSFLYTIDMNRLDFGEPVATLTFSVVARDTTNNTSQTPSVKTLSNPIPGDVPSLTATTSTGAIILNWEAVTDSDIVGYNVYASPTPSFDPDPSTLVFTGNVLTYTYPTTSTSAVYFLVTAVDVFGQESGSATDADTTSTSYPDSDHDTYTFTYSGPVALLTGTSRLYFDNAATVLSVRASVGTAPTGSSLIVDVLKNGTTLWNVTPANKPAIAISGFTSGAVANMDTTAISAGDYLTLDITQIGSTIPGSDLVVTIRVSNV